MKKAQVSVFIMVGLIVLSSVVLFLYYKAQVSRVVIDAPAADPLTQHVQDCLGDVALEGIERLSAQGGFIELPLDIRSDPSRYYSPDGQGVVKIPLWFYKGVRLYPSVRVVELSLNTYIQEHLDSCLDFSLFEDQYTIRRGKGTAQVSLNRADVSVVYTEDILVSYKTNATITRLSSFSRILPVHLREMLQTSIALLESEVRGGFLENFTIDLMASNPAIPFTDMKFGCDRMEWEVDDLRAQVSEMLMVNLPRIRIQNTLHRPFLQPASEYEKIRAYSADDIAAGKYPNNAPSDSYEYLRMFWDADLSERAQIRVGLQLTPAGTMDFMVRPNKEGILTSRRAEGSKDYLRFLCINVYHFLYSLNYPVIVTLRDEQGYTFQFAMPVTIKNNEPYKLDYGYEVFRATVRDEGFCADVSEQLADLRAIGSQEGFTTELDAVNMSLECIRYTCSLGETHADEGIYRLRAWMPSACSNPFIIASKEGYRSARGQLSTDSLTLQMTQIKKIPYEVVVHTYNGNAGIIGSASPLGEDMNVSIQLLSEDADQFKLYPLPQEGDESIRTIEFAEGDATYSLDMVLTQDDEYIGGYRGEWRVQGSDVRLAQKVVFHVIRYVPTPFSREDKLKMIGYITQGSYEQELRPQWQ